ncbi:MAG: GNAT family N-acetyltransferase [Rhizobiaceae bacterium]|nr:GNAT family N-acetyltransferase [Rhizobiaceae bacterium]
MEISISNDRSRIDFPRLCELIQSAYWGKGRAASTIKTSFDNSLCFIAEEAGQQVGFARVITDYSVIGYLCDILVFEEYRGRGISRILMAAILEHPQLSTVESFMLATSDAHGLYEKYGFQRLDGNSNQMKLLRPPR